MAELGHRFNLWVWNNMGPTTVLADRLRWPKTRPEACFAGDFPNSQEEIEKLAQAAGIDTERLVSSIDKAAEVEGIGGEQWPDYTNGHKE